MIFALLIFLAIGSYLNSLAYRLLHLEHFWAARSFCPSCKQIIAWYDNIPVISWIYLQAQCRSCQQNISWLYPLIEIITTCALFLLWQTVPVYYFPAYFLFFIALIVTIRTDFDQMLISRFVTLYLIPCGILATIMHRLPLTPVASIAGALFGYGLLWLVKKTAFRMTGQQALGQGDLELLSFIGACTGPLGCWISLLVGSVAGTIISMIYMAATKQKIKLIPFGAYLSFGAMAFVLYQDIFIYLYHI
jgi:leader peptidase (prepilin peptidase) / N-methyltransferase